MGKPINKRNFGNDIGTDISIVANVSGTVGSGFIVKQSGTRKYLVNINGDVGMVRLVNKDQEDLLEGEAIIQAVVGSDTFNVSKLTQHRATVWGLSGLTSYSWKNNDAQIITIEEAEEEPEEEPEEPEAVLSIEYEWIPGSIVDSFTFVSTIKSDSNIVTASDISWTYNISATWESGTETYSDSRIGNSPNFEIVSVGPTVPDTTSGSISATWNGQTVSIVLPE
jgi:hypothetical protein